jgi:cob(I)alamin adenosyltransferase
MATEPVKQIFVFSKKGDSGTTSLLSGERISKANLRPEAYGTLDEASSMVGVVKALTRSSFVKEMLDTIERIEKWIRDLQLEVPLPREFVHPGATLVGAVTDVARTIVRRAERRMAAIKDEGEQIRQEALSYINRLADFLFTLARYLDATEKAD